MPEKKLTSRQMQAINTKNKIFDTAMKLIESEGLQNVTVEAICSKAEVSVGSFYNSFKSKNDILTEIYVRADEYFLNTIAKRLSEGRVSDKILHFFDYYARYNISNGIDFVKQLYNTNNPLFVQKGRHMQTLLQRIIEEGQRSGEISTKMTAEKVVEYLFVAARGVCFDWCIHDGEYELDKFMVDYMREIIEIFII